MLLFDQGDLSRKSGSRSGLRTREPLTTPFPWRAHVWPRGVNMISPYFKNQITRNSQRKVSLSSKCFVFKSKCKEKRPHKWLERNVTHGIFFLTQFVFGRSCNVSILYFRPVHHQTLVMLHLHPENQIVNGNRYYGFELNVKSVYCAPFGPMKGDQCQTPKRTNCEPGSHTKSVH